MQIYKILIFIFLLCCFTGCSKTIPVNLPKEAPQTKSSDYGLALSRLGKMTKLLRTRQVRIQTVGITDDTGVSHATGGDIPFDITEMIKSAVNSIGGQVVFVPYDPVFLKNQAALKFTSLKNKTKPDVVLHGGITEYDRALEVKGDSGDFGGDFGAGKNSPSMDMGYSSASSISRITLDVNMMDFETMAMVPQVQAVNSIRVFKGSNEAEMGFSLMGATFGLQGSVKKIQGHHAAVRTLVDLSVLEVIGKYLHIPYWKCIDRRVPPDPLVMEHIRDQFKQANDLRKILMIQRLLRVYGAPLKLNGRMDEATTTALHAYKDAYSVGSSTIDADFYAGLFNNMPIFTKSLIRQPIADRDSTSAAMKNKPPLRAQIQASKREYHLGENINIRFSGNEDYFGRLIYVTADGTVVQLLPNQLRPNAHFLGGAIYAVPGKNDSFTLSVAPPLGAEQVVLFASTSPLPTLQIHPTPKGLGVFPGTLSDYSKAMREAAPEVVIENWPITTSP